MKMLLDFLHLMLNNCSSLVILCTSMILKFSVLDTSTIINFILIFLLNIFRYYVAPSGKRLRSMVEVQKYGFSALSFTLLEKFMLSIAIF